MKKTFIDRLGGRKFLALVFVSVVGYSLVIQYFLDGEVYFWALCGIWLGYNGINVAQKVFAPQPENINTSQLTDSD